MRRPSLVDVVQVIGRHRRHLDGQVDPAGCPQLLGVEPGFQTEPEARGEHPARLTDAEATVIAEHVAVVGQRRHGGQHHRLDEVQVTLAIVCEL